MNGGLPVLHFLPNNHRAVALFAVVREKLLEQLAEHVGEVSRLSLTQHVLIESAAMKQAMAADALTAALTCDDPYAKEVDHLFTRYRAFDKAFKKDLDWLGLLGNTGPKDATPLTFENLFPEAGIPQPPVQRITKAVKKALVAQVKKGAAAAAPPPAPKQPASKQPAKKIDAIRALLIGKPPNVKAMRKKKSERMIAKWKRTRIARTDDARERKKALIARLGPCANCGSTKNIQPDHKHGRKWQVDNINMIQRVQRYEADEKAGLLRALCATCNQSDGARGKR